MHQEQRRLASGVRDPDKAEQTRKGRRPAANYLMERLVMSERPAV